MKPTKLSAHDGHALSGYRFDPEGVRRASIVIAPAMAEPQSFYAPFARHLAANGFAVWTFDYRGTGESLSGSMRGAKADLTDWYARDYDAVVNLAADTHADAPLWPLVTTWVDEKIVARSTAPAE